MGQSVILGVLVAVVEKGSRLLAAAGLFWLLPYSPVMHSMH